MAYSEQVTCIPSFINVFSDPHKFSIDGIDGQTDRQIDQSMDGYTDPKS